MSLTVQDLFATPDLYLSGFDGENALFVRMDREAYHRSIFLDARIEPLDDQRIAVPAEAIAEWAEAQALPLGGKAWIFHVANCGSTLLARALDRLRGDLVLREPMALRQLGVDRASMPPAGLPAWALRLRLVAAQLGKRYRPGAPVIVKANVPVNFILPELMALDPAAPAIFLYYPLDEYILAIARTEQHRDWVMRVSGEMRPALARTAGDITRLDPVERAAALWLGQMSAFSDALGAYPNSVSLDAATLFGQPRATVAAAARLFDLALAENELDAVMGSTLFTTYSKNPGMSFGEDERRARALALAETMAPDLKRARAWVETRLAACPLPDRLARPLLGESPALL